MRIQKTQARPLTGPIILLVTFSILLALLNHSSKGATSVFASQPFDKTQVAATFTVVNTADSGAGSLRQAILDANASAGADTIAFAIPGMGVKTIALLSALPIIIDTVTIDGTTQSPGSPTPLIELNGAGAGEAVTGLHVLASNCVIRGLVINRFKGNGIELGSNGNVVEASFIGTDATGTSAMGNRETGVVVNSTSNNRIGGSSPGARNVISGNFAHGVLILGNASGNLVQGNFIGVNASGSGALGNVGDGVSLNSAAYTVINNKVGGTAVGEGNVISGNVGVGVRLIGAGEGNLVQGNFIGTNSAGTGDLGNSAGGVDIFDSLNNTIGGAGAFAGSGAGNVISGNDSSGVRINSDTSVGNRVQGNFIGTQPDGRNPLPNASHGVVIVNSASGTIVGGTAQGEGNTIAFNNGAGVFVGSGARNAIQSNSIFFNAGLGIDLSPSGPTPNDPGDGDTGANLLQNFPMLSSAGSTTNNDSNIQGTLNSAPSSTFTVQFFSSPGCDAGGSGEGQFFIGSTVVTTDASGNASFNVTFPVVGELGRAITATAFDSQGNTSEFSPCVTFAGASELEIALTASPPSVTVGSNITYTITLTNNGPNNASSVVVSDMLPASTSFVSCSSTLSGMCGGTGNNRTITFNAIQMGEVATITITAKVVCSVATGTIIQNTATVTSPQNDEDTGNNSATASVTAFNPGSSISPTSQSAPASGGVGTVNVMVPAGCDWTATSNASWITLPSANSGTGPGTLDYLVADSNGAGPRTGTITIAGLTFTVNQTDLVCTYSISPVNASFAATGGTGFTNVTAPDLCRWKAKTVDSWINITSGENGIGNGTVNYSVAANTTGSQRIGTIDVEGRLLTITQAAGGSGCSYTISPGTQAYGTDGGEAAFNIIAPAGCPWTASTVDDWINITSSPTGTGNGQIAYLVRENFTGRFRVGAINVAGLTFIINQDGGEAENCNYALVPSFESFPASGGSGSVTIIAGEECIWRARSNAPWITITSDSSGLGTGTITYSVGPHAGASGRKGTITIGGKTFSVKQKGSG